MTQTTADQSTRRGRLWLAFSFIACPCHLPITMAVLATLFGGSAFGSMVSRNTIGVGIAFGIVYLIGVGIGFKHLRAATKDIDCSTGSCEIPAMQEV